MSYKTSAQDALSRAALAFNDGGSALSGTRQRGAAATFSTPAQRNKQPSIPCISLPAILNNAGRSIPPITSAVPEPETYALMALGLVALYFKKRAKNE